MDVDADIAHVTQNVAVLALRHRGAEMAAEPPIEQPQVVLRMAVDLDAAELVDALAVLQEIARERDALRHRRQRDVFFRERVERLATRLGAAQRSFDLRNLVARELMDPVARRRELRPAPGRRRFNHFAHVHPVGSRAIGTVSNLSIRVEDRADFRKVC